MAAAHPAGERGLFAEIMGVKRRYCRGMCVAERDLGTAMSVPRDGEVSSFWGEEYERVGNLAAVNGEYVGCRLISGTGSVRPSETRAHALWRQS